MLEPRRTRSEFLGAFLAGILVLAFCLALLAVDPLLFWNDDYELSILPVFADMARSWGEGSLPLLSPYSWVCANLAGEFQYGTFSVFVNAVVVLIWQIPLTFAQQAAALSIVHLFVLAMGGYLLARGRDLAPSLATMVALVAALNGWIICWGATDWFGALGAFAWLPWAWWGMERALDPRRGRFRFLWPAPFVYLVVTGGFPYTVLMLGLVAAWLGIKFATANPSSGGSLGQTRKFASLLPLFFGVLLGVGLAAPAWLALLDYVHGSARAAQDSAEHFQWRVPVAALPAFILPNWTVKWADFSSRLMPHTATELASGLVAPVALLAGLIAFGRAFLRTIKWEFGLLLLVLLLCMLPTANVFRWSFRWLPLLHLVLALCAAEALQLFAPPSVTPRIKRPGVIAVLTVLAALAAGLFAGTGGGALPLGILILGIAVLWALVETIAPASFRNLSAVGVTFVAFFATYLCIPPNCGVPKYNLSPELTKPAPLDPQRLYLSVYPPPEDFYRLEKRPEPFGETLRLGSTSMWAGVRLVNGYSPIRPPGVAREFAFAIHGEIPPGTANYLLSFGSNADGILARIGVDGIIVAGEVATSPQPDSEWEVAATTKEGRVFHRRGGPFPVVRSIAAIDSRPDARFALAEVSRIENLRNQLAVDVAVAPGGGPALLTISRPFFKGYRATIGDRPLPVDSYRGLIPTIEVPAGTSGRLTLIYRPWWLTYGAGIAAVTLLLLLGSAIAALAGPRRT
jgi:hypothetical protein